MASEAPQSSPDAASLLHSINLPLLFPFFLGFSTSASPPDQSGSGFLTLPERFVLINPFTQSLVVIGTGPEPPQGAGGGRPPASRASVEAMPAVEVEEGHECECAICLENLVAGEPAKEMPCKHRFHGGCIERWLGVRGTCPVCRYEMPVEEGEAREKREGGVWVSFAFGVGGADSDGHVSSSSSSSSS
ncbi:E3 ubiquitin-protein ligase MPSR1-like [Rhodamnia argentea]|uniref:RING-type E3 ubiquitin transferase n=1 Tax=Rhodamnia argentea TaxID=178133 RepID=A0A8B8QSU8_9MYRT|nr:E3 ubiquitin-protein ligase MPSR1-like [Rhodamnia argentea]